VGVVGWQVLSIVTRPPAPAPAVPSARSQLPPVPARGSFVVDRICTAYTGSGPVEVSFRLTNNTGRTVRVLTVEPQLPLGMLRPESARFAAGSCTPTAPPLASGAPLPASSLALGPGDWVPVTFFLTPLVQCPQPAPVGARVATLEDGVRIDRELALLSDLGSVTVPGCG